MLKKIKLLLAMFAVIMSMVGCKFDTTEATQQFTITYDANDYGTTPDSKKVDSGYELTEADLPFLTEDGFEFKGWKLGEDFVSAGYKVTEDITLKAEWAEIQTYTVTFDANGHGIAPETITGKRKGDTITLPAALEANGYTFDNWTDGTNTYPAGATYTVTGNATITATWKAWNKVSTPTFSVTASEVDYGDTVTITCATPGAEIHYTTDGTEPTASSPKYTAPVSITADGTLKAIAIKAGMNSSDVASANYTIKLYTITIDTAGHGTNPSPYTGKRKGDTITLPAALESNGYTFDNWTDGTNTYPAGATYTVTGNATITATWKAWNTVSTPTFSVTDSAIDYGDTVAITCTTTDADIYYTTDGRVPTTSSTKYTAPITITAASTIKAIAIKAGMNNSAVAEKSYTIKTYTVTFDADGHGTAPEAITGKHKGETVTLPAALTTTGFTFNKWNDGTADYDAGATYTVNGNVTVKAKWIEWNTVAAPTFSKPAGEVDNGNKVTIACATPDADIYYTTDGTAPTANSTKYANEEIQITAATTIKAIAVKSGMNDSSVTSAAYTIKLYTVTFDANGHGTAPDVMKGYKGQTITLPAAPTEAGWLFEKWNDGTTDYAAEANYTVAGDITIKVLWKEIKNVTNFTATCVASGTVKLTWTNPTGADFAKVVITYGTSGSVTVLKTVNPNNEATVTELTNGTEYTFTVKAYDNSANASSGVNKKCTPFLGTVKNATNKGGLEGYTNQTPGAVIKESWMDTTSGNIKIGSNTIAKTSEVVVIPTGTVATVKMPDDSSWRDYIEESAEPYWKGVYLANRKVKLDPFVMSQYEVTQKLYSEVMGENPSFSSDNPATDETQENRPVEKVTWFQACAFCNELTKKTMTEADCVYYSDEQCATPYTKENANSNAAVYAVYNTETKKWTKKGYRLPTEAEWEFAARGGDPNAVDSESKSIWSYAYAGVQTEKEPDNFTSDEIDEKLVPYGWYYGNSSSKTHEVGLKEKNKLNLYDMSGNVREWCYDKTGMSADSDDSAYTVNGYVQNPVGASSSVIRCCRGGNYLDTADGCSVSLRNSLAPSECEDFLGFRLVRSTESN